MSQTTAERIERIIKDDRNPGAWEIADEIDALTERNAFLLASAEAAHTRLAECRAELATARAFISSVIDAPKDYPAEVSA